MKKKVGGGSETKVARRRFLMSGAAAAAGLAAAGPALSRGEPSAREEAPPRAPRSEPTAPPPLPDAPGPQVFRARIDEVRRLLRVGKLPGMIVFPGADLFYLTRLEAARTERPIFLVVPAEREVELICPGFVEQSLDPASRVVESIHPWQDDEDPFALLEARLRKARMREAAVAMGGAPLAEDVEVLRKRLPGLTFAEVIPILAAMRRAKSAEEIACLEAAATIAQQAVEAGLRAASDGVTEEEIASQISDRIRQAGASAAEGRILAGPPSAVPYGPSGRRRLEAGDVILAEFAARVHGYWGGVSRSAVRGAATPRHGLVYGALIKTWEQVVKVAAVGRRGTDLDTLERGLLEHEGLRRGIRHRLGQGVGLERREPPILSIGSEDRLMEGDVVSIEPGIYTPKDCGIRIGDLVQIAAAGALPLTRPPATLPEI